MSPDCFHSHRDIITLAYINKPGSKNIWKQTFLKHLYDLYQRWKRGRREFWYYNIPPREGREEFYSNITPQKYPSILTTKKRRPNLSLDNNLWEMQGTLPLIAKISIVVQEPNSFMSCRVCSVMTVLAPSSRSKSRHSRVGGCCCWSNSIQLQ